MPATFPFLVTTTWSVLMAAVMIGVDPHKGSHTAVVIGAAEEPLGEIRVRAPAAQTGKLVAWAAAWPERTWAVEGAGGLGRLLAQQLVAAGERVPACSRSWRPGCGCCRLVTRARTTPATRCPSRSRRCGPGRRAR